MLSEDIFSISGTVKTTGRSTTPDIGDPYIFLAVLITAVAFEVLLGVVLALAGALAGAGAFALAGAVGLLAVELLGFTGGAVGLLGAEPRDISPVWVLGLRAMVVLAASLVLAIIPAVDSEVAIFSATRG